jgi:hypothetical protein
VDANDYFLIDKTFAGQSGMLGAGDVAAVPEPGLLGMICGMAAVMMRSRRAAKESFAFAEMK